MNELSMAGMSSQQLEEWIQSGTTRVLAGERIFVRTSVRQGLAPLLLIHGYPTSSYDWCRVWPQLAERYSLYACDMLGFGMSAKPRDAAYSIAQQADICCALLDACGVAAPHVLAHDYGDTVAQELLARERAGELRLGSVCFLNGGLFPETHRARPVQKLLALPLLGLVVRDGGRPALARLINYMEQRRRNRTRWVGALVESRVPRRLICGADDPVSGEHLAVRYRELVPDPDVILLDGVGHYPQLEDPGRVLEAYFAFRDRTR